MVESGFFMSQMSTFNKKNIHGVEFKKLDTHTDHRGFFREIIKNSDGIFTEGMGQISHSLVYPGVIKAWHAHKTQTQWNYVVSGSLYVALHDLRKQSPTFGETMTFLTGQNQESRLYKFPSGVAHGYKCLDGAANILYITSGEYDLRDEIKMKHDDVNIGFDWLKTHEIT